MNEITFDSVYNMIRNYQRPTFMSVNSFFLKKSQTDNDIVSVVKSGGVDFPRSISDSNSKVLYLVSGSIATGKSTIAYEVINYFGLQAISYLSSDSFYKAFFESSNFNEDYAKARQLTDILLDYFAKIGKSFVWETVLSKEKKKDYLIRLKELGYTIVCFYVHLKESSKAIARSELRVQQGYHEVPEDFIRDRYNKSKKSLSWLLDIADKIVLLENDNLLSLAGYADGEKIYFDRSKLGISVDNFFGGVKNEIFRD